MPKPKYYIGKYKGLEAADIVADFQSDSYNLGTALTYLLRAGKKRYVNDSEVESKVTDILKAIDHLNFELEILTETNTNEKVQATN